MNDNFQIKTVENVLNGQKEYELLYIENENEKLEYEIKNNTDVFND